jgi:transcription antitermination factor NusG
MPWYAISCAAAHEDKIAAKLGVCAYVPKRIIWRKVRRRTANRSGRIKKSHPLIPGYVLVNLHLGDVIYDLVRRDRNVFGMVASCGEPLTIRDHEIEYLKSRENLGHYDETKEILQKLIGGQFEIHDGALEGRKARVTAIKNRDLMMEVDGFPMPVAVSIESFENTRHSRIA